MGALALFTGSGVPPARRALSDLLDKTAAVASDLERLKAGRRRLVDQLELVDGAKHELESLIAQDSRSIVDRVKNSVDWALSGFGGARARRLAESLAASRLQNEIGSKAAVELDAEIERLSAELEALRAEKPSLVRAVLVEVASCYRDDLNAIADELRQVLSTLGGLDKFTSAPTGDWVPNRRVVVTIPSVGGVPETVIVAPNSAVDRAEAIWRDFAADLDADPFATVESLQFPSVRGDEDDGRVVYSELSRGERLAIDLAHASGVK
jgi:archaellum component FlaC